MRIIDDWLDDWISERKNIMADDIASLCEGLRESALSEGYSLAKLRDASNGDVDRFVRRVVVSRMISESTIAPLAPPSQVFYAPAHHHQHPAALERGMRDPQPVTPAHRAYKACIRPHRTSQTPLINP